MDKLTAKDTKLRESYNERTRRGQAFTADLSQYDEKLRPTIQRAIDNGEINNTRATHAFIEGLAKIEAEKGIGFDFTNNKKLAELGLTVAGRNVGGYVDGTNVTLNLSSSEALNKVVGHEVTHVFEGSGQYDALMSAMKEFAAENGIDWDARVQEMAERYKNVKNADPEKELLADLVGEYLFTDSGFVESLSTKNPGLFKKIFEEIKYLAKTFAGTKQGAALEKVKKTFAELYRAADVKNTAQTDGVKYYINTTENGTKYVRLDGDIFKNEDGSSMTPREAYNSLVGKKITLEDGDVITFIKKLPKRDIYKELFLKLPGYEDGIDVKAVSEKINKNIVEVVTASQAQTRNEAQRHPHIGIKDFDQREVYLADDSDTYRLELCIANLTDGTKIAYVKRYIERASEEISEEIKKAETAEQIRLNQPSNVGSSAEAENLPTTHSIRNPDEKVNGKFSLSETKDTAPAGGYRITGEDIALALTREDIARMEQEKEKERIATAQNAPRNDVEELGALRNDTVAQDAPDNDAEELGAPTREDILQMEAKKSSLEEVLAEGASIRSQLRNNQDVLNAMQPVAEIQTPAEYAQMDITKKKKWVEEKLRPTGYKVERKGFGIIDFAKKRLKSAFNYFDKNSVEEATFEAIPFVLENGVEIENRNIHKDRNYGTVTIAAPITINGKRGNMAVVVKQTNGNYYKVHRVLTPDGSVFHLPEMTNEAESTPAGESPITGSLATPKDSASVISISDNKPSVKQTVKKTVTAEDLENAFAQIDEQLKEDRIALVKEYQKKEADAITAVADKNSYIRKRARELHRELSNLKKGVRASSDLSYMKDSGFEWEDIKVALVNISTSPGKQVNINSQIETSIREALNGSYELAVDEKNKLHDIYQSRYEELVKQAVRQKEKLAYQANKEMEEARKNRERLARKDVEAVLGEKGAYVSKQANALYDEVKGMQKGKRVSNTLSYLLDTLDLSEEHKAESYGSLRTALLNIRDNPDQVVNPNSAVEAAAREMLGREYDSMAEDFANAEGVAAMPFLLPARMCCR